VLIVTRAHQISDLERLRLADFAQILQNRGPSLLVSDTVGAVGNGPIGAISDLIGGQGAESQVLRCNLESCTLYALRKGSILEW
jgi:hypothetical protein